ncbi:MAG: ATP-binding protein [Holophaga sp.]|nr:ATP-binding protein [Holophaga sp.]
MKGIPPKIRAFLVPSLLVSIALLGILLAYHFGVQRTTKSLLDQQIATKIDDAIFSNRQTGLQSLTRAEEILRVATGLDRPDNPQVTVVLETARRIFDSDLIYVLDKTGTVVSCTRYEGGKTLTGNSYAFRPYFKSTIEGKDTVYPALGITTGQRGLYFSTPVSGSDRHPVGVVVVKVGLESIDAILASHASPVFLVSPDGVIFASNRKEMLYRILKPMSAEALARIKASKQFGDQELNPFPDLFNGKLQIQYNDEPWSVSKRTILSDWTIVALVKGAPAYVIDKNIAFAALGALVAMMTVIAVLTSVIHAKKKAETALLDSENRLREVNHIQSLILDNSTVGITFVKNRVFEWVNPRMSEILGLPQERIRGASTRITYATEEEFERIGCAAYSALADGERFEAEFQSRRADGTPFWSQILGKALDPSRPEEGSIWIFEEITARKHAEESLRTHQERLEESVKAATAELREKNHILNQLNEEKNQFFGIVAHDLRNPLNGIVLAAQLMEDEDELEEMRQTAKQIYREGMDMAALIGRFLDISAIESGKIKAEPVPFDLAEVSDHVMKRFTQRASKKGITLRFLRPEQECSAWGDLKFTKEILDNLISNALKFSPPGSEIRVRVEHAEEGVRVSVEDEGPGLTDGDRQRLFGRFARLSAQPTGGEKSTGLGLSIVKHMVDAMGGQIRVESEPGCGSAFRVELPSVPSNPDLKNTEKGFNIPPAG